MVLMGVMPAHIRYFIEAASHVRVIQRELQTCLPGACRWVGILLQCPEVPQQMFGAWIELSNRLS